MINKVNVTITSNTNQFAGIVPFSHESGLQTIVDGLGQTCAVVYKVPAYDVKVDGGGTYLAVRYGMQNNHKWPAPVTRRCDAGLYHPRICAPSWKPVYSPHSFVGAGRVGAWVLLPHKGFYIHEGPDRNKGGVGGSLGCIEIMDARWNEFLDEIEHLGNASCAAIGGAGKLKVRIEGDHYPNATLLGAIPVTN